MDFLQNIPEQTRQMATKILNMEGLPVAMKLELLRKTNLDHDRIAQIEEFLRESPGGENPVDPLRTPEPTENELEIPVQEIVFAAEQPTATEAEEKKDIQSGKSIFSRIVNVFNPFSTMSAQLESNDQNMEQAFGDEAKAEKKSRFLDGFPEETNILLLGMEGCGKVEFINSFANYLKYENFDEALKNGPEVVIPTDSFQLSRKTQKTQEPKVYSFMVDGAQKYLRFIDTPDFPQHYTEQDKHLTNGFSTRHSRTDPPDPPQPYPGRLWCIEQARHSTKVLLKLVKNFGQIHAILIFVRSDEKHIISYTSYLREAFQKVHYQASKNIIFCFTSIASIANTSYRFGESAIKDFADWSLNFKVGHEVRVAKNNTYCFENDSYRLLCAHNGWFSFLLSENATSLCRKHWTLSAQETFRLLGHIKTLTPFSNSTLYTTSELMPVLSDFFVSRIVQIVVADKKIQERSNEFKRSFPKLMDFCVKLEICYQRNVLAYSGFFAKYLTYLRFKNYLSDSKIYTVEVKLDPSIETMVRKYFEREMEHYANEKETYMNYLQETGSQITLEDIIAKELPAIEPYFAEESKEWKRILTEQQILSRPHSARLITITNDWYCNPHDRMWVNGMFVNI